MRAFCLIIMLLIGNFSEAQTIVSAENNWGKFQLRADALGIAVSKFQTTTEYPKERMITRFLKYGLAVQYETKKGVQFGLGSTLLYNNILDRSASFRHYTSLGYVIGKNSWQNIPQVQFGIAKGILGHELQSYSGFAWQLSKSGIYDKYTLFIRPQFAWYFGSEKYSFFNGIEDADSTEISDFELYEFRCSMLSATIGIVFNLGK